VLSSFQGTPESSSDDGEEVTPVPMPNTEVKLFSADGSWGISPCKSRTSLGNEERRETKRFLAFFVWFDGCVLTSRKPSFLTFAELISNSRNYHGKARNKSGFRGNISTIAELILKQVQSLPCNLFLSRIIAALSYLKKHKATSEFFQKLPQETSE
jgi:hypothetical protein